MRHQKRPWQETKDVLNLFSNDPRSALDQYVRFIKDGVNQGHRPELMGGGLIRSQGGHARGQEIKPEAFDSRILGSGSFVEEVLTRSESQNNVQKKLRGSRIGLEEMAQKIAGHWGVQPDLIFRRDRARNVSQAKAALIRFGIEFLGKTNREMAEITKMSEPAAVKAKRRVSNLKFDEIWPEILKVN